MPKKSAIRRKGLPLVILVLLSTALALSAAEAAYQQTNLVANIAGPAANTDAALVNPWGIAYLPTSPLLGREQRH